MGRKILGISLAMVIVLSFTACSSEPTAQEIVDSVIESMDEIKTYQFKMDMTMDTAGEVGGESLEQDVKMDNNGTLDLENEQAISDIIVSSKGEQTMRVETYVVDGTVYSKPEIMGQEPMWMKSEMPAAIWERMKGVSGLENYQELLKTAGVEVIESEKVNGVDCYVLELTPDMPELYRTATNPVGGIGPSGVLPPVPEEFLQELFSSFSVKQWIAKDTYFLMKAELDVTMTSTPELMDYVGEEGEMSVNITLTFKAYNYNEPVSIKLPPEAEEAVETPM